jgi:hypothetical protein
MEARTAVNAMAWPYYVDTQSARQVCRRAKAGCDQRRWRRGRFGATLPLPVDCASVTTIRRCASKAIFPTRCPSEIKNSTTFSACSAVPLTTFSQAVDVNNVRSASQLAVSAASIAQDPFSSVEMLSWRSAPHLSVIR